MSSHDRQPEPSTCSPEEGQRARTVQSNIIDLGLVSEILVRNDKVYFSITVPAEQAEELEPLRQAAEKVVREISGVAGVTAVLTAELRDNKGRPSKPATPARIDGPRVAQARAPATPMTTGQVDITTMTRPIVRQRHRPAPRLRRGPRNREAAPALPSRASNISLLSLPAKVASANQRRLQIFARPPCKRPQGRPV